MDGMGRLRWRCRRGMQELDLMLLAFIDGGGLSVDDKTLEAFQRLLEFPDDALMDFLMKRAAPPDGQLTNVIEKIRSAAAHQA